MKKRKLVALVLAMTMMMSSTVLVHAADKNTVNGDTTNGDKTVSSIVKTSDSGDGSSAASAFIVAVPANVTLARDPSDPAKFKATYSVGVKGVLASGKYVSVVPAASFEMTGQTVSDPVTAHVTQAKTKWVDAGKTAGADETVIGYDQYANADGEISVYIQKADVYTGTLGFTVKLN